MLVNSTRSQEAVRIVQDAAAAQSVIDRLRSSGLSQTQAVSLLAPRVLPVDVLDPNVRNRERNLGLLAVGLVALLIVLVFYGQAVAQGQKLGLTGCTGTCTGDHVHFEVHVNNTPVDPLRYLPGPWVIE